MQMNLERALACEGFMSEAELRQLATWARSATRIVEIGSYMGRSTRALSDNTDGTVIAVDDFGGLRELSANPMPELIVGAFTGNLSDHISSSKVTIWNMDHGAAIHRFDGACDLCFIDGSHDYESVSRDIQGWMSKVNGLLCGHDFDVEHSDVMRAVDELLPGYRVVPGTTLWWVNLGEAMRCSS